MIRMYHTILLACSYAHPMYAIAFIRNPQLDDQDINGFRLMKIQHIEVSDHTRTLTATPFLMLCRIESSGIL